MDDRGYSLFVRSPGDEDVEQVALAAGMAPGYEHTGLRYHGPVRFV